LGFGSTFPAINKRQLAAFMVPIAPVAEQQRIVAKVDELHRPPVEIRKDWYYGG
jgi:restriction endonuclease S subunit